MHTPPSTRWSAALQRNRAHPEDHPARHRVNLSRTPRGSSRLRVMTLPVRPVLALAACLLLLTSCGSDSNPPAGASAKPSPTFGASHRGDIDVLGAVLVMNSDGSATLSARIVNHTKLPREIGEPALPELSELDAMNHAIRIFDNRTHTMIQPGATATTGNIGDPVRIRIVRAAALGKDVRLRLGFRPEYEPITEVTVSLNVPVVERSSKYANVAGEGPNTAIKVENARIVIVPGQKKAYVNGTIVSTIDDAAYRLPTAKDADGKPVPYLHQTATGGPYGILAEKGKNHEIGAGPPYKETGGDADYFNAKDLTVGETITVTISFGSADVIVPFKVVSG